MATPFPFTSGQTLTAAQMNAVTTLPVSTKTASYTAVVGDVGSRIVMNVASANTVTINNSIFAEGDTIFIANKGAGATTVTAGAGVTINSTGSLTLAQHGGGTLVALSASVFAFFSGSAGVSYGTATGGTAISPDPVIGGQTYRVLQFNSTATLTVSSEGLFDVLVCGGGGAGGTTDATNVCGGGGAGQMVGLAATSTIYLSANQTITIGAGAAVNNVGTGSAVGSIVSAAAGGVGGSVAGRSGSQYRTGGAGGSGGGGSVNGNGGEAIGFFGGNNGGAADGGTNTAGGGGGGSGAVGAGGAGTTGGAGGAGSDINAFLGTSLFKCGGGGGSGTVAGGAGGSSIGGAGGVGAAAGGTAAANTASGGGGGAQGGSGIVYVRFKV